MKLRYVRTGFLAKKENVTTQTIRRWVKKGKYKHIEITDGGDLRIGIPYESSLICYARVSSKKQTSSLTTQIELIKAYAKEDSGEIIKDIGSGFNFKRKGFVSILDRAIRGEVLHVVVSDQDRLTRVGFDFIKWIIEHGGGTVRVVNEPKSKEGVDYENLISFITVFCNSYYGKRSNRNEKNKNISEKSK